MHSVHFKINMRYTFCRSPAKATVQGASDAKVDKDVFLSARKFMNISEN